MHLPEMCDAKYENKNKYNESKLSSHLCSKMNLTVKRLFLFLAEYFHIIDARRRCKRGKKALLKCTKYAILLISF
jgi:hypothetical protein